MNQTRRPFKVMLVNPAPREIVQGSWYRMPLLGLGYLAAFLREEGFECRIVDAMFERLSPEETMARIKEFSPALLGFTAMTHEVNRAAEIASEARRAIPKLRTVIGGPHSTAIPERTLRELPAFDFAVFGEGEETLAELVRVLEGGGDMGSVAGLAFRDENGGIRKNIPRSWREDLDHLPFPAWDLYPRAREYQIFSSRGCPYRCSFCMRVLGEKVRYRTAQNVVREFELVTERYRPREISFSDEIFTLNERRTIDICNMLIAKGLHLKTTWFANARANCASPKLYSRMREAGCVRVGVGIESGNQDVLNRIRKGITLEKAREMVRVAKGAGLEVAGFFIIGHPDETEDTIRDTIAFAREVNPSTVAFGLMVPYPGTEIATMASRGEGGYRITSRAWGDYDKYFGSALELENLSRRKLEKWQVRAYLSFYLRNFRIFSLIRFLFSRRQGVWYYLRRRLWKRA